MKEFVKVAAVGDLSDGEIMLVEVEDERIVLSNLEGTFHAIGEECTHEGGLLSEGYVEGTEVECPNHGSLFDLKTGENTGPPVTENVPRYSVRVEGDDVLVGPSG